MPTEMDGLTNTIDEMDKASLGVGLAGYWKDQILGMNALMEWGKVMLLCLGKNAILNLGKVVLLSLGKNYILSLGNDELLNLGKVAIVSLGENALLNLGMFMLLSLGKIYYRPDFSDFSDRASRARSPHFDRARLENHESGKNCFTKSSENINLYSYQ